jgi:hypothetical protein
MLIVYLTLWTAGIGKTMLGCLLLYWWACAGKRVVAAKAGVNSIRPMLFCQEGAFTLTEDDLISELNNPEVM